MKSLILRFWIWLTSLWRPKVPQENSSAYLAVFVNELEEVPPVLNDRSVYFIGMPGNEWLVKMLCPCGCGGVLMLNLLSEENPYWTWEVHTENEVSLSPSVWRTVGCKSHFFLKRGEIQWCEQPGN